MSQENVDIEIIRAIHELISDEVYGVSWLGVLDVAASKNSIYNAITAAIGVGGHLHDMDILELDGIDSDGGAFSFSTTGAITFNQNLEFTGAQTVDGVDISALSALFASHLHDGDILQQDGIDSDGGAFDFKTTGALNLKVSGDNDDYLQFATVGNVPYLYLKGTDMLYIKADAGMKQGIRFEYFPINYGEIYYDATAMELILASDNDINFNCLHAEFRIGDNTLNAFRILQGGNVYQEIKTINGSEAIAFRCGDPMGFAHFNISQSGCKFYDDLDMDINRINNIVDPALAQDAATKAYVDSLDYWTPSGGGLDPDTLSLNNIGIGTETLNALTTGDNNIAIGHQSLYTITDVSNLIAIGFEALKANTTGTLNVAIGYQSLSACTTGSGNVAIGYQSLSACTTGSGNIAIGHQALNTLTNAINCFAIGRNALSNNNGNYNFAFGNLALQECTSGTENTAIGYATLQLLTTGINNVAIGTNALHDCTIGMANMAIGRNALMKVTSGQYNIAIGASLGNVTTGFYNVAIGASIGGAISTQGSCIGIGYYALEKNLIDGNIAIGGFAGRNTTTGNILAIGYQSVYLNTTGTYNIGIGYQALAVNTTGNFNTVIGYKAMRLGATVSSNTVIGYQALYSNVNGSGNIAIGCNAGFNELGSNTLYIHNTNTATPLLLGDFTVGAEVLKIHSNAAVIAEFNNAAVKIGAAIDLDCATNGAYLKPRRLSQAAQPVPDSAELMIWRDTDDDKTYLIYNDPDVGVRKIEMV